jgi:aspartate aminotransferase
MFESLSMAPSDAILGLTEAFKTDPNPDKINLGVGVYQDASGKTPILGCVKAAERILLDSETSKGYLGMTGIPSYTDHIPNLLFGADNEIVTNNRAASVQTPGGTAALRVAADFVFRTFPHSKIWFSTPTWANHQSIFKAAGLDVRQYDYLNADKNGLDFDAMLASLRSIPVGDVVCLHACCHNPTGVDATTEQWGQIAEVIAERKLLPLVDFAYQGFGDGLDEDRSGLAQLIRPECEILVCNSFSKNFGLYGERVGGLTVVAANHERAQTTLSHVKLCVRTAYSNPPKHGAAIVSTVLDSDELRTQWVGELASMRERINEMRQLFVETLKAKGVEQDFSFITRQRGMFSFSGLNAVQVDQLKNEHSIYIVGSGRINVAGMTKQNMDRLCSAIAAVVS